MVFTFRKAYPWTPSGRINEDVLAAEYTLLPSSHHTAILDLSSLFLIGIMAILTFYSDAISKPSMYVLFFLLSVFSSAVVVIGFTANKELFPVEMAGTATGLVNLFPFAGGALFQPVIGYILESYGKVDDAFTLDGYEAEFMALFVSAIIAFLAALFSKETLIKD